MVVSSCVGFVFEVMTPVEVCSVCAFPSAPHTGLLVFSQDNIVVSVFLVPVHLVVPDCVTCVCAFHVFSSLIFEKMCVSMMVTVLLNQTANWLKLILLRRIRKLRLRLRTRYHLSCTRIRCTSVTPPFDRPSVQGRFSFVSRLGHSVKRDKSKSVKDDRRSLG